MIINVVLGQKMSATGVGTELKLCCTSIALNGKLKRFLLENLVPGMKSTFQNLRQNSNHLNASYGKIVTISKSQSCCCFLHLSTPDPPLSSVRFFSPLCVCANALYSNSTKQTAQITPTTFFAFEKFNLSAYMLKCLR